MTAETAVGARLIRIFLVCALLGTGCDQGQPPRVTGFISVVNASQEEARVQWQGTGLLGSSVLAPGGELAVSACGSDRIGVAPGEYRIEIESAGSTTAFNLIAPVDGQGELLLVVRPGGGAVKVDRDELPVQPCDPSDSPSPDPTA